MWYPVVPQTLLLNETFKNQVEISDYQRKYDLNSTAFTQEGPPGERFPHFLPQRWAQFVSAVDLWSRICGPSVKAHVIVPTQYIRTGSAKETFVIECQSFKSESIRWNCHSISDYVPT